MTSNWPPVDLHAHIDPAITARDLLQLRAVIFAATRTLDEAERALARQHTDVLAVWGVGTHPGLEGALKTFEPARFAALIAKSAYVSEVGLDGKAKSRIPIQREVLNSILAILQEYPRITSLHSYGATAEVLELLEKTPVRGVVLHWWLGDSRQTARALELGAYFSVNSSNLKHKEVLAGIPLDRLLTETDHPDGNRWAPQPRHPGNVSRVESILGELHGLAPHAFRNKCWSNLKQLTTEVECAALLPERVRSILAEA
ncbi:TatD family hydrolase [Nocardioides sp. AN3]